MFSFALGLQDIAKQQEHLAHTVRLALQEINLPITSYQRHSGQLQRRGREQWQWQLHKVSLPSEATLATCDFLIRKIATQTNFTVFDRQEEETDTGRTIELSLGIDQIVTDLFVLAYQAPSPSTLPDHLTPHSLPALPALPPAIVPRPTLSRPPSTPPSSPQIAIVIDDLGWDFEAARVFLTLDIPLSFAILPHTPHATRIAQEAQQRGRDILLHLPMEPHGYPQTDPGPQALLSSISKQVFFDRLTEAFTSLPQAVGVNNHMGSRLTESQEAMHLLMQALKQRQLFFLDSRTSEKSLAYAVAQALQVPAAQRHVFLDHDVSPEKITAQFQLLSTIAVQQGFAIAIGHPYPETIRVLQKNVAVLRQAGYEIVPVSRLVR